MTKGPGDIVPGPLFGGARPGAHAGAGSLPVPCRFSMSARYTVPQRPPEGPRLVKRTVTIRFRHAARSYRFRCRRFHGNVGQLDPQSSDKKHKYG
jgi:hypothetical protein